MVGEFKKVMEEEVEVSILFIVLLPPPKDSFSFGISQSRFHCSRLILV